MERQSPQTDPASNHSQNSSNSNHIATVYNPISTKAKQIKKTAQRRIRRNNRYGLDKKQMEKIRRQNVKAVSTKKRISCQYQQLQKCASHMPLFGSFQQSNKNQLTEFQMFYTQMAMAQKVQQQIDFQMEIMDMSPQDSNISLHNHSSINQQQYLNKPILPVFIRDKDQAQLAKVEQDLNNLQLQSQLPFHKVDSQPDLGHKQCSISTKGSFPSTCEEKSYRQRKFTLDQTILEQKQKQKLEDEPF